MNLKVIEFWLSEKARISQLDEEICLQYLALMCCMLFKGTEMAQIFDNDGGVV